MPTDKQDDTGGIALKTADDTSANIYYRKQIHIWYIVWCGLIGCIVMKLDTNKEFYGLKVSHFVLVADVEFVSAEVYGSVFTVGLEVLYSFYIQHVKGKISHVYG